MILKKDTVEMIEIKTKMSALEIKTTPLCIVYKKSKDKLNSNDKNKIVKDFLES